MNHNIEDCTSQ
jgi:hypothetical protein